MSYHRGLYAFLTVAGMVLTMGDNEYNQCGHSFDMDWCPVPRSVQYFKQQDIRIESVSAGDNFVACVDKLHRLWIIGDDWSLKGRRIKGQHMLCFEWFSQRHIAIQSVFTGRWNFEVYVLDSSGRVQEIHKADNQPKLLASLSHLCVVRLVSGEYHFACQTYTADWYMWGYNKYQQITSLCECREYTMQRDSGKNDAIDEISPESPHKMVWRCGVKNEDVVSLGLGCEKLFVIVKT